MRNHGIVSNIGILIVLLAHPGFASMRVETCAIPGPPSKIITEFGTREASAVSIPQGEHTTRVASTDEPLLYSRALIQFNNRKATNWHLALYDSLGRLQQSFVPTDFGTSPLWSNRIDGNFITTVLTRTNDFESAQMDPQVSIESLLKMPQEARRTYHSRKVKFPLAEWKPIESQETFYQRLGESTGIILMGHNARSWICTGVFITSNFFLTNWHCGGLPGIPNGMYWDRSIYLNSIIDLSWDGSLKIREFRIVKVEAKSENLDFALLKIAPMGTGGFPRPVALSTATVAPNTRIVLIHHPEGLKKQVTFTPLCTVLDRAYRGTDLNPLEFSHTCDTEGGSSGAPIFNQEGFLVGIHHRGWQKEDGVCDEKNKAVHLSAILQSIKPALRREIIRGSLTAPDDLVKR